MHQDGNQKLYSIQKEADRFSQEPDLPDLPEAAKNQPWYMQKEKNAKLPTESQRATIYTVGKKHSMENIPKG